MTYLLTPITVPLVHVVWLLLKCLLVGMCCYLILKLENVSIVQQNCLSDSTHSISISVTLDKAW